jgi:prefoldin alpha subunit
MPKTPKHTMNNDDEIQRKYMQYQILKQQLSALIEEKSAINGKTAELSMTISALQKLPDIKNKEEMWSTLGSGTFIRSDIKDTENVFVAVGAGVVIKEKAQNGITILSKRLNELMRFDREIVSQINQFSAQIQRLEKELEHDVQHR